MKAFEKGDLAIFNSERSLSAKRYKGISEIDFEMPVVILHPFNKIQSAWILLNQKRIFVSYDFLEKENEVRSFQKEDLVEAWFLKGAQ